MRFVFSKQRGSVNHSVLDTEDEAITATSLEVGRFTIGPSRHHPDRKKIKKCQIRNKAVPSGGATAIRSKKAFKMRWRGDRSPLK